MGEREEPPAPREATAHGGGGWEEEEEPTKEADVERPLRREGWGQYDVPHHMGNVSLEGGGRERGGLRTAHSTGWKGGYRRLGENILRAGGGTEAWSKGAPWRSTDSRTDGKDHRPLAVAGMWCDGRGDGERPW